jgi:bacterioferritin
MKAKDPKIIEMLNDVLTVELTAINQYFLHAEMQRYWGYERLHQVTRDRSIEEMKDAEELIRRILFLEGVPNVQRLNKINIGETVPEQFQADLAIEHGAVARLNDFVARSAELGDQATSEMFQEMVREEERHVLWFESQLAQIKQIGIQN